MSRQRHFLNYMFRPWYGRSGRSYLFPRFVKLTIARDVWVSQYACILGWNRLKAVRDVLIPSRLRAKLQHTASDRHE